MGDCENEASFLKAVVVFGHEEFTSVLEEGTDGEAFEETDEAEEPKGGGK